MENVRLSEIFEEDPHSLVFVKGSHTIERALGLMKDENITSIPLVDEDRLLMGNVSLLDIVSYLTYAPNARSMGDPIEKTTYPFPVASKVISSEAEEQNKPIVVRPDASLSELLPFLANGLRRILLEHSNDKSKGKHYVGLSQSDILVFLLKNRELIGKDFLSKSIAETNAKNDYLVLITTTTSAMGAFKMMATEQVTALPVVDQSSGKLITTISASDIRGLTEDDFQPEKLSRQHVLDYLKERLAGTTRKPHFVSDGDSMETAMKELIAAGVHRIWVVDDQQKPTGVLSQTDFFRALETYLKQSA